MADDLLLTILKVWSLAFLLAVGVEVLRCWRAVAAARRDRQMLRNVAQRLNDAEHYSCCRRMSDAMWMLEDYLEKENKR